MYMYVRHICQAMVAGTLYTVYKSIKCQKYILKHYNIKNIRTQESLSHLRTSDCYIYKFSLVPSTCMDVPSEDQPGVILVRESQPIPYLC